MAGNSKIPAISKVSKVPSRISPRNVNISKETKMIETQSLVSKKRKVEEEEKVLLVKPKSSVSMKKKRPAWDTKGRLQDMENLAEHLNTKFNDSEMNVRLMEQNLKESTTI